MFFRVYSGVVNSGDTIYNPIKGRKERIGRILQMHANQREDIKEVRAGDIAAAVGLKEATTGDTLCEPDKVITLEKMIFPEPVIHVAVEPKTKADQEKMGIALNRLAQEDRRSASNRTNRSDDHLRHGRAPPGDPRRPDEARVRRRGERRRAAGCLSRGDHASRSRVEGKFIKQSGGHGQYRARWLKLEPNGAGKGFEFVDAIKGGTVPREYIPAVQKGLRRDADQRRACRVSGRRYQGHAVRRLHTTKSIRTRTAFKMAALDGVQGRHAQGEPDAARADDGGRSRDARGLHGQCSRRPVVAARHDPGHGRSGRRQGRSRRKCRSRRCSATRRRCARCRRGARRTRWSSSTTPRRRRAWRTGSSTATPTKTRSKSREHHGQGQIRADEAARERGDDRARGSREDDADGGDHDGAVEEVWWGGEGVRPDRQCAGGEGAGDHDQHGARGVRDGEAALRARGLSGARGLHQEHDHGCGADGRGDPGGECGGRADAADAGAHSAGAAGGGAVHRGVPEQGGHGGRQGAAGAGGDGGAGAVVASTSFRGTRRRS